MRAAIYTRTGPAHEVLSIAELARPEPDRGCVRVRVQWSGVNPSDTKSRAGTRSAVLPFPRITPHSDGAGHIDAVGEDVDPARVGERVWLWNAAWGRPDGTAAEFVVVPAEQAVRLPDGVDLKVGALLGIPALTAYHAVHMHGGVEGKRVLVAGGAGAVGHYAVQMARLTGAAQVIATVSNEAKATLARDAGADATIDYRRADVREAIRVATDGRGVDRIIEVDFAANATLDFDLLARDGDVVIYGSGHPMVEVPFVPGILKNISCHFFIVYHLSERDRRRAIDGLTALLASGALQHNIAAELPLERIADAHALVEGGKAVGNVIVSLGE
ncbi:NADPH:quinone reductase [Lysobacter sp. KIS68-7]|uniref:NADPH:quinone reductase n=1 Tax=Lysobacter sp. KIS68-7 TaxID=2904252 RepID=UPI001E28B93F|nr:NADPH:quinone reductase [Lysobacter sp. KIS68-7]UHQ20191.1 NADPH:quinone reductase [Lysobacter sp. KIS68-7]